MPITSLRKILQLGGSKTVALPPGWLDATGLELGDEVRVVADGAVLIMPVGVHVGLEQLQALVSVANKANKRAGKHA